MSAGPIAFPACMLLHGPFLPRFVRSVALRVFYRRSRTRTSRDIFRPEGHPASASSSKGGKVSKELIAVKLVQGAVQLHARSLLESGRVFSAIHSVLASPCARALFLHVQQACL